MADPLRDYKPGGELKAELLTAIIAELLRWRKAGSTPPLNLDFADGTSSEPPQFWVDPGTDVCPALVGSTDIPGGSPSSPASGTVKLVYDGGSVGSPSITAGSETITVYNASPCTASSGSIVWLAFYQGNWYVLGTCAPFPVTLTSTLTAKSGSTPGTGTANPQTYSGSLGVDTGTTYTILSNFSTSIASGKTIWVTPWAGALWILTGDCP